MTLKVEIITDWSNRSSFILGRHGFCSSVRTPQDGNTKRTEGLKDGWMDARANKTYQVCDATKLSNRIKPTNLTDRWMDGRMGKLSGDAT